MRQIKFRGKRIDNGQWVYGFYHNCVGNANFVVHNYDLSYSTEQKELNVHWILQCSLPDSIGWDIKDSFTAYKVDPKTVGQFTGLLDKNGKEIYTGDILSEKWKVEVYQNDEGTYMVKFGVNPKSNKPKTLKSFMQGREKAGTSDEDNVIISNIHETL